LILEQKDLLRPFAIAPVAFTQALVPHTRLKAELAKQSVAIHAQKRGIFTVIGAKEAIFCFFAII
jgi:hypothetical protein